MSRIWSLADTPHAPRLPVRAAQVLLTQPPATPPSARVLALLNAVARVDYLSWVAYADDGAAPLLVAGEARRAIDSAVTPRCFALYREHFWRSDESTLIAGRLCAAGVPDRRVTALQVLPGELPSARWREEIYESARLVDRLSFLYRGERRRAYAFNLYRDRVAGAFAPAELEGLLALAPALTVLLPPDAGPGLPERLRRVAPSLSPREVDVCAAIASGLSADGIALQLDVAPSTVHTLRKRAYAKLADAGLPGGRLALLRLAARP